MKAITQQLRDLGYTNRQIKTIHNRFFRIMGFKCYNRVERIEDFLRFYDDETGMIFEFNA